MGTDRTVLLERTNAPILCAVASGPVIGVLMGQTSKGFGSLPLGSRVLMTVATLYLAVALFGAAGGVYEALSGASTARVQAPGASLAKPLEWIAFLVLGVTASGYVLFLAPLAYLNHLMVDAVGREG